MSFSEQYDGNAEQVQTETAAAANGPGGDVACCVSAPAAAEEQLPELSAAPVKDKAHARLRRSRLDSVQALLSTIVIALFVITFIVQAFQIPSPSMEKTLLIGDYLLVDKVHFGESGPWRPLLPYRDIQRGDIVVFHYPIDPSQHFVKRVIGLPGDRIRMNDTTVYVNDVPLRESYVVHTLNNFDFYRDNFPTQNGYYSPNVDIGWHSVMNHYVRRGELVVPDGHYFVMGDNRDNSLDSRYWGFVPRENIVGRPLVIYLSLRGQSDHEVGARDRALTPSSSVFVHMWQFARWNRMFHLIR